ncbi:unnamed protein product [Mesocestoides corti]|uniref:Uncharacterized protein n=2 Tax=Mesocestoides corti TaxID=53468 RepID=A0A0R3UQ59_MESCO|nr:unnamed protein product [Mesocestoides corti]
MFFFKLCVLSYLSKLLTLTLFCLVELKYYGYLKHLNALLKSEMQAIRRAIFCAMAPKAIGPYSQAICVDKTIYTSGQLGLKPDTMDFAAGGHMMNIVKTTVLLANIDDFPKVNEVYLKYFTEPYPARVCFAVKTLPKDALIEIDAIAVLDK